MNSDISLAIPTMSQYGEPPECCKEDLMKICEGLNADQLQQCSDFFQKQASNLRDGLGKTVTIEDFEKLKGGYDVDQDGEEGEE